MLLPRSRTRSKKQIRHLEHTLSTTKTIIQKLMSHNSRGCRSSYHQRVIQLRSHGIRVLRSTSYNPMVETVTTVLSVSVGSMELVESTNKWETPIWHCQSTFSSEDSDNEKLETSWSENNRWWKSIFHVFLSVSLLLMEQGCYLINRAGNWAKSNPEWYDITNFVW